MDFLKNAIEAEKSQKRKALEASQKEEGSNKKYISRAELERQREEEYRREHEAFLEQERLVKTILMHCHSILILVFYFYL